MVTRNTTIAIVDGKYGKYFGIYARLYNKPYTMVKKFPRARSLNVVAKKMIDLGYNNIKILD